MQTRAHCATINNSNLRNLTASLFVILKPEEHMDVFDFKQSERFAEGMYRGIEIVAQFMNERQPTIKGVFSKSDTQHRDDALKGLWSRALAWINTLVKLNS